MMSTYRERLRGVWTRSWWLTEMSLRRVAAVLFGIVVPVAMLAVPSKVSVDGIFYVTGAKALFQPEFAEIYPLFREPGYPAFLKLVHALSSASLLVVGAQAILLTFAGFAALYALNRSLGRAGVSRFQVLLGVIFVLNPVYITYAGHFMQQSLFAGLFGAFVVLVEWARRQPPALKKWHVVVLLAVLSFAAIWTSIGWLYLSLFPTALALSYMFVPNVWRLRMTKPGRAFARTWKVVLSLVAIVVIAGGTYVVDRGIYSAWETVRDAQTVTNPVPTEVVTPLTAPPKIGDPVQVAMRYGVLMGIGVSGDYPKENDQFLHDQMRLRFPHSEWDTAYVNEPFTSFAPGYFTLDDPSLIAHTVFALGSFPVALPVYSLMFVLGHVVLLIALIRRKWFIVGYLMIPVSWIGIHALSGTPIDRYGIPAYAMFAAGVALALDRGLGALRDRADRKASA